MIESLQNLTWQASFNGLILEGIILLFIIISFRVFKNSGPVLLFDMMFEKTYAFFEDILGVKEKPWIKLYITIMFFIILISNLLGIFLDFLLPAIGEFKELHPLVLANPDLLHTHIVEHYIKIPTADINFNLAMAIVGVIIVIYEQFRFLGIGHFFYEYFPVLGKNYIPFERGNMPVYIDWPLFLLVKFFDIIISLFLGVLDIVGHLAKLISLSFRLFGNVTSGSMLLMMLITAISGLTYNLVGFEFPVIAPLIIYLQGILVAFIQALVFPLLVAIFIKVAKVD